MYELRPTNAFRRDVRRCKKRSLDIGKLTAALDVLAAQGALPAVYKPHPLRGEFRGCIDAHIAPDWVLIYEVFEDECIIALRRTGTHQDVFKQY